MDNTVRSFSGDLSTYGKGTPNPALDVFDKLQKKFEAIKLKEEEEKQQQYLHEISSRFDVQARNFESNLFNAKLYGQSLPLKEFALEAKYEVSEGLEEYIYLEYFKSKYPYSVVTSTTSTDKRRTVKIVLLDSDRDTFLAKHNIKVEERMIPEFYFV